MMEIKIQCTHLNEEGKGVFQAHGKNYALANLLPQETALVQIDKNKVLLKQLLITSQARKKVNCPVFGRCGGCQFQHCDSTVQNDFKMRMMQNLYPKNQIEAILTMPNADHYRHKVIATFSSDKNRKLTAGIYEEESHSVIQSNQCLIQHDTANRIIETIVKLANQMRYSAYDEDRKTGLFRHCLLRISHAYDDVLVCLVLSNNIFPGSKNFVQKLRAIHPEVKTVIMNVNARATSVVLGNQEKVLYGSGSIKDKLCGLNFLISAKTFYQVNPAQTAILYTEALKMAQLKKEEIVLDAYCGIGTISLLAAKQCRQVVGVEINPISIKNAIQNASANQISNVKFYAQDCGQFMLQAAKDKIHFDCVLMDPAREGADKNFLESLIKLRPDRIVYISCGPTTQKRDTDFLIRNGYKIMKIQPVDLFPATVHVESIVLLTKV